MIDMAIMEMVKKKRRKSATRVIVDGQALTMMVALVI